MHNLHRQYSTCVKLIPKACLETWLIDILLRSHFGYVEILQFSQTANQCAVVNSKFVKPTIIKFAKLLILLSLRYRTSKEINVAVFVMPDPVM